MGLGRPGARGLLLEEEASGAHCVGLKQTILFPFVTLGSLINFCDCLMAGGTSRKDHSEVGSSYIHFNFTPDGDKTTASLFGDVPRGVMLDQPPIFLGGQGGAVGPVRRGLRHGGGRGLRPARGRPRGRASWSWPAPPSEAGDGFRPHAYREPARASWRNNVIYLANLVALEQWYTARAAAVLRTRRSWASLVYRGRARDAGRWPRRSGSSGSQAMAEQGPDRRRRRAGSGCEERIGRRLARCSTSEPPAAAGLRDGRSWRPSAKRPAGPALDYIETIQRLAPRRVGAREYEWLQQIVDSLCAARPERFWHAHGF